MLVKFLKTHFISDKDTAKLYVVQFFRPKKPQNLNIGARMS